MAASDQSLLPAGALVRPSKMDGLKNMENILMVLTTMSMSRGVSCWGDCGLIGVCNFCFFALHGPSSLPSFCNFDPMLLFPLILTAAIQYMFVTRLLDIRSLIKQAGVKLTS